MLQYSFLKKHLLLVLSILFVLCLNTSAQAMGRVQTDPNEGEALISLEEANQRCEVVLAIFNKA